MTNKIRTVRENLVYENVYVRVWDDDVQFPGGTEGTYFRMRWKAPHGVVIAPTDGTSVLLIENHRYGDEKPSLELPQGFGTAHATPEDDATRELREETGLTARSLSRIAEVGSSFKRFIFAAEVESFAAANFRSSEYSESFSRFELIPLPVDPAVDFSKYGIFDEVTMIGLLLLSRR